MTFTPIANGLEPWGDSVNNGILDVQSQAVAAQATANTANTAAGAAQGTANTALANAATAQTTANSAQTTANGAVANSVTLNDIQTVPGDKTFTGNTTITGLPAQDMRYAISLTGSNGSNISLGVQTYLDGSKPFTFGTWVDFRNNLMTDDGSVWGYGYSSGNNTGYVARVDGATKKLTFFYGSSQVVANNTFCYGRIWLVLTYDGVSTLSVYKNNVLKDTLTIASRNADLVIGSFLGTRDATARNLNGALDAPFLYSRVLTAAEMTQIYRTNTFPSGSALFQYQLDERTGTTATDSSGAGNNGTINSGTYYVSPFGNPNRTPTSPALWQASVAGADLAKTCAIFIGSSTTQGADSTVLANRYTDVFGQILHRRYNASGVTGGAHVRAADAGWTTTGTVSLNGDGLGLGSWNASAGATMAFTQANTTGFDLHFVQGPGQGTFTYQVDGGTAVTVTPNTGGIANRHDGNVTVTGLTLGSHTVQVNATNACIINGIYFHNGDATTGVRIYNSGKGSTTTADFITTNAATIWQRAVAIGNVNMIGIMLSSNDFSGSIAPATFQANLLTQIHNIWSAFTYRPDIVLINSYKRFDQVGFGTVYTYNQYGQAMQNLANELDGVQYVDVAGFFPLVNDAVNDPLDIMNVDNIHMNDGGHRFMAQLLHQKLVPSFQ